MKNETVGERIKRRRKELELSVDDLADKIGKNRATIYRYESDEIENLPLNILEPLAQALGVTPAYLMGWENEIYTIETKKVPLLGTIAAGEPIFAEENYDAYIEVDQAVHADFCVRVKGDSMIDARINDGDLVFIRQQPEVENGEIAAVLIDNEVTFRSLLKWVNPARGHTRPPAAPSSGLASYRPAYWSGSFPSAQPWMRFQVANGDPFLRISSRSA